MATASMLVEPDESLAELVKELGDIPLERIRRKPAPGTATEADVIAALEAPRKRICELVDGVLVEKAVGTKEALLSGVIIQLMWNLVEPKDLGVVIPGDGPLRLWLGLVRYPDVSFVSWDRVPGGEMPAEPVASIIPDLAVEVLSKSNTKKEMERKIREYFEAGVRLVWLIDHKKQIAHVYTSSKQKRSLGIEDVLDGEDVLPGFVLPLKELFSRGTRKRKRQ